MYVFNILLGGLLPVVTCTLQILSNLGDSSFTFPANDKELKSNEAVMVKFWIVLVVLIVILRLFLLYIDSAMYAY